MSVVAIYSRLVGSKSLEGDVWRLERDCSHVKSKYYIVYIISDAPAGTYYAKHCGKTPIS